jgi:hypothetical protein
VAFARLHLIVRNISFGGFFRKSGNVPSALNILKELQTIEERARPAAGTGKF